MVGEVLVVVFVEMMMMMMMFLYVKGVNLWNLRDLMMLVASFGLCLLQMYVCMYVGMCVCVCVSSFHHHSAESCRERIT